MPKGQFDDSLGGAPPAQDDVVQLVQRCPHADQTAGLPDQLQELGYGAGGVRSDHQLGFAAMGKEGEACQEGEGDPQAGGHRQRNWGLRE